MEPRIRGPATGVRQSGDRRTAFFEETLMSKRARKRRDRKKGGANHGKRPNA
jgi:hypothetical protein